MSRRTFVTGAAFAVALGVAGAARASATFPAYVETVWNVSSLPVAGLGCKLCHSSDQGNYGTVVQPFGQTMRAHGLVAGDTRSLYSALVYVGQHSVQAPIVDSDGDGVADYTEVVVDHTNPNDPKDFKQKPTGGGDMNAAGGAGGDSGTGDAGDEGGQAAGVAPPPLPSFEPPSGGDLPPTFVHGCTTAVPKSRDRAPMLALFATLALASRRARRRARRSR